ncbi:hypothetical protein Tco_1082027 [Tanacetum coccineum]|uniref:Uncharacterized protein n=1 Tax=Tanacetum coccineum TaxID=301880 RepID=A0ABQ5HZB9_9ASTR
MYYPRFTKVIIHYFLTKDKTVSRRNKIGTHTSRDNYLINTLRFVSANEVSQIYGARLPESMISPEMRETKAYKTYLVYATGVTPPKKARKFKNPTSPKLITVPASPKEPTKKSKRVKRAAKKSTNAPTTSVVIRDTPGVSVSNKKAPAKTDKGKGIELLSDATLLKDAQLKKALKKSKQETHKLQASGLSEGADFESEVHDKSKAKSSDTSEGTSVKLGVPDVSKAESSWGDSEDDNESDHYNDKGSQNDDDDSNDAQDSERTDSDEEENPNINVNVDEEEETQEEEDVPTPDYSVPTDEETDDENKEFDDEEYAGLYKDVNVRSKVIEHEEVGKGNVEMTDATRESDNVPPVIDEVASMMNVKSTPTPEPTTEPSTTLIPALLDFSSLFGFDHRVSILEKELSQLKQVDHSAQILTSIISQIPIMMDDHLGTRIRFATQTDLQSYTVEFEKNAQEEKDRYIDLVEKSIKDIIKDEVKSQLPQILPKEVSDFTTPDAEPTKDPKTKESKSISSKGTKSQSKSSGKTVQAEEPEFEVADSDMPQNQEGSLGNDDEEPMRETPQQGPTQSWLMTLTTTADKPSKDFDELMSTPIDFSAYIMNGLNITNLTQETLLGPSFKLLKGTCTNFVELKYDFEECYKALSEKLDWDNSKGGDYPFNLTKPLPLVLNGIFKYPVKVAYNKHAKWGISHWREQRKTFYGYARGLESSYDVYSTKHIMAVTRVEVMRKQGYGYLREIEVQRVDNELYTFKEGNFPRLRINDIEDMVILVVQNRLTNLLDDDVSDMVIKKRVKDLQLGVKSYQKKINVTKPETTRPSIKKRDPYTLHRDPYRFIYVDNQGRNRLMRSDELYKFSDGTLTRLQTSLEDITKNIQMEYLPQRRWSSLEKKRAHIMIKAIDKQLKKRRMMRRLENFCWWETLRN